MSLLILQCVGNRTTKNRLRLTHTDCSTRGWLRRLRLNPGNKVHCDKYRYIFANNLNLTIRLKIYCDVIYLVGIKSFLLLSGKNGETAITANPYIFINGRGGG